MSFRVICRNCLSLPGSRSSKCAKRKRRSQFELSLPGLLKPGSLKNQSGFGIVEVIVTTFVFSIISIIVTTNFVDILKLQRRGFVAQTIQEEALFTIESMSREIRVSQVLSPDDLNCNLTSLSITHPINGATTYTVSNGVISKTVGGSTFPITSSKVNFSRLNFCIRGTGIDAEQPRITVIASVKIINDPSNLSFDIQTTVSSRDLSEEF